MELCKLDCKSDNSDVYIAQNIWKMTVKNYHLVNGDYLKKTGLEMIEKGKIKMI